MNRDDETWSHLVELGWLKVTNLLPNTTYKVKIYSYQNSYLSFVMKKS